MKPNNVNPILMICFAAVVVIAIVVMADSAWKHGSQMVTTDCTPNIVEMTSGPVPVHPGIHPGQIHVSLDRVGELDCVWVWSLKDNDWLPIGGKGCPIEGNEIKMFKPQGESDLFFGSWKDTDLEIVFFPLSEDELRDIHNMEVPGFDCVKKEDGFHCTRRLK